MGEKKLDPVKKIVAVIGLILLLSSLAIRIAFAQAGQVGILPTDDAYVDSSGPTSNYGGSINLQIENYQSYVQTHERIIWLKFDLSSIPNGAVVDTATLHLYASNVSATFNVHVYPCSDTYWTEASLTYSNMPSYNTTSMDSVLVDTNNQWYNWSVVDAVKNALNSNATAVTVVLLDPSHYSSAGIVSFDSKETPVVLADDRPALTVHWSGLIPEFPMLLVLPFLIVTLSAVIVYRKKHENTRQN